MFENFTKRHWAESFLKFFFMALRLTSRSAWGTQQKITVHHEVLREIRSLPAVRRKHVREHRDHAIMWCCVMVLIGFTWAAFGASISVITLIMGLFIAWLMSNIMSVTHKITSQEYDVDLAEILWIMQKPLFDREEDEEDGVVVRKREDMPLLWDAAYVMSKKAGLPFPVIRIVEDPKVTAQISPHRKGAEICIDRKTISFIKKKKVRAYVLFGHEYGHWIENDWRRTASYLFSAGMLCGVSCMTALVCFWGGVFSFILHYEGIRLCIEGVGLGVIGALLSLAYGTIGYVARMLDSEIAADAIAAYLVGSPEEVSSFFSDGASEWIRDPYDTYSPFRRIVHPPMRVRARKVVEDALG